MNESLTTRNEAVPAHAEAALPLNGVALRIVPESIEVALRPDGQADGPGCKPLLSPYHRVGGEDALLVTLTRTPSAGEEANRPRLIRLTVQGGRAWNAGWCRWNYSVRRVPELRGGAAVAAQDIANDDESALTLLVLPEVNERREASLVFAVSLAPGTAPGDYPFTVVATDVEDPRRQETTEAVLRLRYPVSALLEHMPAVYRDALSPELRQNDALPGVFYGTNAPGAGYVDPPFFARFLRGFDDVLEPLQAAVGQLHLLFGADTAPPDFLPWLAQWVALVLDENWPELRRRRLIREAITLYRWRGTRRGLRRFLEIYAGVTPEISDQPVEGIRLGRSAVLGADRTRLGSVAPHTFLVSLAVPNPLEIKDSVVRAIIDAQKPAHTRYTLRILPAAAAQAPPSHSVHRADLRNI